MDFSIDIIRMGEGLRMAVKETGEMALTLVGKGGVVE